MKPAVGSSRRPWTCLMLVVLAGCHKAPPVEPTPQVVEIQQRSVTEDPAVMGNFPTEWRVDAGANVSARPPEESEISEFTEMFQQARVPRFTEGNLAPGATRKVEIQVTGPTGLTGSARWIGPGSPLPVTIAFNGTTLATGTPYHLGTNRGGSHLQAQTPAAGVASMSVTNTSAAPAKVRIVFAASP